jgi:hypothetical protein
VFCKAFLTALDGIPVGRLANAKPLSAIALGLALWCFEAVLDHVRLLSINALNGDVGINVARSVEVNIAGRRFRSADRLQVLELAVLSVWMFLASLVRNVAVEKRGCREGREDRNQRNAIHAGDFDVEDEFE